MKVSLADAIIAATKVKKWNRSDLARYTGVSGAQITRIWQKEGTNTWDPEWSAIVPIAKALGLSLDMLAKLPLAKVRPRVPLPGEAGGTESRPPGRREAEQIVGAFVAQHHEELRKLRESLGLGPPAEVHEDRERPHRRRSGDR